MHICIKRHQGVKAPIKKYRTKFGFNWLELNKWFILLHFVVCGAISTFLVGKGQILQIKWVWQNPFDFRERSSSDVPLASQIWWEEPPRPCSPPAAGLPRSRRVLFHRFLLLHLITLPPFLFFLLLLRRQPEVSFPHQVRHSGLRSGSRVPDLPIRQLWQQPTQRAGGRREAPVHQPRHLQPREGQAETERSPAFSDETLQTRPPGEGPQHRRATAHGLIR